MKIYKILLKNTPIYIGCTSQSLQKRLMQHKTDRNSSVNLSLTPKELSELVIKQVDIRIKINYAYTEDIPQSMVFILEETLTYIYGYTHKLLNVNAGNKAYYQYNDIKMFEHIHRLVWEMIEDRVTFGNEELLEICYMLCNICKIRTENLYSIIYSIDNKFNNLLKQIDNYAVTQLTELEE